MTFALGVGARRPACRGLSLTEIMFSLVLVGIILLAMLAVLMTGLASIRQGHHAVAASNVAAEALDHVRGLDFADIPSGRSFDGRVSDPVDPAFPRFPPAPYPRCTIRGSDYWLRVSTSPLPMSGSRLLKVDVSVFWRDKDATGFGDGTSAMRERSLTLTSVVSYANQ